MCKADVIKYMLSAPVLKGRLEKWMLALAEFDLKIESTKAVKAEVLADLIVEHGGNLKSSLNQVHGSCSLMDQFANMVVGLEFSLFHPVGRSLNSLL